MIIGLSEYQKLYLAFMNVCTLTTLDVTASCSHMLIAVMRFIQMQMLNVLIKLWIHKNGLYEVLLKCVGFYDKLSLMIHGVDLLSDEDLWPYY